MTRTPPSPHASYLEAPSKAEAKRAHGRDLELPDGIVEMSPGRYWLIEDSGMTARRLLTAAEMAELAASILAAMPAAELVPLKTAAGPSKAANERTRRAVVAGKINARKVLGQWLVDPAGVALNEAAHQALKRR